MAIEHNQEKERGKASIVLLIGTSSAGKGTIINELLRQDIAKPANERLNWQEEGLDLEARRRPALPDTHQAIIDSDQESKAIHDRIADKFSIGKPLYEILLIILGGEIKVNTEVLDLTKADDADIIRFTALLPTGEKTKYTKEIINDLKTLTLKHREAFHAAIPNSKNKMEAIFERAIAHSKQGKPTIIDTIPLGDYDVVAEFNKYMAEHNFSCPTHIAVAHCDIPTIVAHMDQRNKYGGELEIRDGFFPIEQYAQMYMATDNTRAAGTLTIQDVLAAATKYGANRDTVVLLENNPEVQGVVKAVGFPNGHPHDKHIKVTPKIEHDSIYQTNPTGQRTAIGANHKNQSGSTATIDIAKALNRLATIDSDVPTKTASHAIGLATVIKSGEFEEIKNSLKSVEIQAKKVTDNWINRTTWTTKPGFNQTLRGAHEIS